MVSITITDKDKLLLDICANGAVQIPFAGEGRAKCLKALSDALSLLASTTQINDTLSKVSESGQDLLQNLQGHADYYEPFEISLQSERLKGNPKPGIRLVSSD